jgi:hypothetical protein
MSEFLLLTVLLVLSYHHNVSVGQIGHLQRFGTNKIEKNNKVPNGSNDFRLTIKAGSNLPDDCSVYERIQGKNSQALEMGL